MLNERQVGAAIEGVLRQEEIEVTQLAVDTHGYTDFGMAFARGAGLDLCPRLKALKDRHLFLPRGCDVPQILKPICNATLDLKSVAIHWDRWVHLIASAYSGHTSAINVLTRFGSAARGDRLYEVGVVIGRLLRTVFLADYFINPAFRRELLRVLNRGEATNALKRLIYTGRVANHQAKSEDEMQAVADALSLLANIVMAWNTAKMQAIFDRWAVRRSGAIPPELIGRIVPTRTEGLNMRGIFSFPIEQYAEAVNRRRILTRTSSPTAFGFNEVPRRSAFQYDACSQPQRTHAMRISNPIALYTWNPRRTVCGSVQTTDWSLWSNDASELPIKGDPMYIGGGILGTILVIALIVWLVRRS